MKVVSLLRRVLAIAGIGALGALGGCNWGGGGGGSAPTALSYASPQTYTVGTAIPALSPTVTGTVDSYAVAPALPAGLSLGATTGQLSGTPTTVSSATSYTITATNTQGSTTATVSITVNPAAPTGLSYPGPQVYTLGSAITALTPTVTGSVASYSVTPALPTGLALNTTTGLITGTPTVASSATAYAVRATNAGGFASFSLTLTVNPVAPSGLSYTSPQNYAVGTAIGPLSPTVTGTVSSYSVSPALPAGLSLNTSTGVISGTPTAVASQATYTVTALNAGGSTSFGLVITVNGAGTATGTLPKLTASFRHTCAVMLDTTLTCWGYNSSAQLGSGDRNSYSTPNPVAGLTGVTAVATGSNDSCAIHGAAANISCWGNSTVLLPVLVAGQTGVKGVAAGGIHKCFVDSASNVWCSGNNGSGQLGNGTTTSSSTPVPVISAANGTNISAVAVQAGQNHSCALLASGSVLCWGAINLSTSAAIVPGLGTVQALAPGLSGNACFLITDGTVQCWTGTGVPQAVAGLAGVTGVAVGSSHTCAIVGGNGAVKCWGTGLMGNGNVSETQPTPQFVSGLTGVVTIAAGFQHTCALRGNHTLSCWGSNSDGQLGTGDTIPRTTPTDVLGGAVFSGP